jgi:hypothetical protein
MVLKSDGKLGVGVTPDRELTVGGVSNARINILSNASSLGASQLMFGDPADSQVGRVYYDHDDNSMRFHTNASEKLRITSAGNVGIGTASPGNTLVVNHSGGGVLDVTRDSNSGYLRLSTDGTLGTIKNGGGALTFKTGGDTERLRILSGGGITFNGDTATANALDDYEEGTWTPTLYNCTGTVSHSKYVKIGGLVYIWCQVNFTGSSGGTITFSVPFNSSEAVVVGAVMMQNVNIAGGSTYDTTAYIATNAFQIYLNEDNSGWQTLQPSHVGSSGNVIFSGAYPVA